MVKITYLLKTSSSIIYILYIIFIVLVQNKLSIKERGSFLVKYTFINIILIALLTFNMIPVSQCFAFEDEANTNKIDYSSDEIKNEFKELLENLFEKRDAAIVSNDTELLKGFYNLDINF